MLRSAQLGAGRRRSEAWAQSRLRRSASTAPEHRALTPPGLPRPPLKDADYWRFADWLAPYFDALWLEDRSHYASGQQQRRPHLPQLPAADDARGGRARGSRRSGPQRQPRPCACPAALPVARRGASATRRRRATRSSTTPAGSRASARATRRWTNRSTRRSPRRSTYAWRARDALRLPQETVDLIADRVSRAARGPFFRFPNVRLNQLNWNCELYAHAATRHRRPRAAGQRLPRPGGALLRRHPARADAGRLAEPRAGIPVPLPAAPAADPSVQPRQRRVRERDLPLHPVPRAGRAGGHAAAASRALPAAARMGGAHRLRLLDPRRLPELGHRLRLQALARRPHLGARAAGTAGDRRLAAVPQRGRRSGPGRSTCSTAASACTSGFRARRRTRRASLPPTSTT